MVERNSSHDLGMDFARDGSLEAPYEHLKDEHPTGEVPYVPPAQPRATDIPFEIEDVSTRRVRRDDPRTGRVYDCTLNADGTLAGPPVVISPLNPNSGDYDVRHGRKGGQAYFGTHGAPDEVDKAVIDHAFSLVARQQNTRPSGGTSHTPRSPIYNDEPLIDLRGPENSRATTRPRQQQQNSYRESRPNSQEPSNSRLPSRRALIAGAIVLSSIVSADLLYGKISDHHQLINFSNPANAFHDPIRDGEGVCHIVTIGKAC